MPEPTDKNPAEQIRTEYVETLARAQRAIDLEKYPQREDGTPREDWAALSDRMRREYLTAVAPLVGALAEAGLLPTAVSRVLGRPAGDDTAPFQVHQCYRTSWSEVTA
ncbi:hypothetical protein [Nocardia sp. NPDC049149]|uniref:hypothetical protein n=1 Tax=Nocardia sp. NPDC049149 TaxID=3364315 RepID=UPI003711326D